MKLFVVGGSGLLGSHTATEALARGHEVTSLARGAQTPRAGVRAVEGDVHQLTAAALEALFAGHDAVVYGVGLDDRVAHARPAFDVFFEDHVTVCVKAARAAKAAGVRCFVVFGSYFTHLDQQQPGLLLAQRHPYVRARKAQRDALLAEADATFRMHVLELPYILGQLPGRVPPWCFLFEMLAQPVPLFFTQGGTAAVTARQVAQASLGAIEGNAASAAHALGGVNWTWPELAERVQATLGTRRWVCPLPASVFIGFGALSGVGLALRGQERGLDVRHFAAVQYSNVFIDPEHAQRTLGYPHDDYERALKDVVLEWKSTRART